MADGRPHGGASHDADRCTRGSSAHHMRPRKLPTAPLPCLHRPPPRVRTSKTAAYLTQLTVWSRACGRRL
eukprot:4355541-Prymnesium_polylepis.1